MWENVSAGGATSLALWIGTVALVLLMAAVAWGFAKIVEYSRRIALGMEMIHRQLGRIHESLEDLRGNLLPRNM